ncbi:DExH-box ATP-dependent RNA helicase DExH8 [Lotus japonicus]|uniref:DExH-box ATP-dependent RNA helicase DExH8 n=1 Tax=Lotus japonicus TaxID=34305 RepID=UPI00258FCAD7|nr:DExH-box ATP-dependent RNA helicase DExH8 [Lotus japonicus]
MASPSPSDSSSPPPEPSFSHLPVMSLRSKIVEKVQENRVTLIVGEAGCGKSSQIPQFLLDENISPILCTLPRRFAVVSVAKMVAQARKCQLGEEVGYHIGHEKNFSASSKIVFKTAGVLLDELQEKGMAALKYKAIILDEVHERSVESDLVLVCVKQFLLKNDIRVVLMSATADISRYRDYFRDLGRGERVEVLAIPSSNQKTVFQRRVSYLEQVVESLGISSELMHSKNSHGLNPSTANARIKSELHTLIHALVLHIHVNEPDIEKSILVFLPTYNSLAQQWRLLKPLESTFEVHILHRSIDTEQALMAMKISKTHRKVILATNIAESSVTIPKVAYVIDSCRSLQVYWDKSRKKEASKLVWVSKSQAEQRRGRTGRTCDGQVYRLVTGSFFNSLEDHECPAILKLSLRLQVLSSCCAGSKAINDPKVLLQKALDPPDPQVVEDALSMLVQMHALEKTTPRGRYEPTFYGRLLASFSLSFDASILVLKFGEIGMLREGILLGIIMDTQPLPIIHPFGEDELFSRYIDCYYDDKIILTGPKEMEFMGNFCAFEFWQHIFKDKYRLENLKKILKTDNVYPATQSMRLEEEDWCSFHNLSQSSLHHVSEIYNDILHSVHRFRPNFLSSFHGLPPYYDPYEFKHTCLLKGQPNGHIDAVAADEDFEPSSETKKCVAVPYVTSNHFHSSDVAKMLATVIKELRVQYPDDASSHQPDGVDFDNFHVNEETCVYFIRGSCNRGNYCPFSHSLQAKRPQCKFFLSLQGCRNGESCLFSHVTGRSAPSTSTNVCQPEDNDVNAASLLKWFPRSTNRSILILDDTDLHFTSCLARYYDPSKITSTTCLSETTITESSLPRARILWGLYHPYQTIIAKAGQTLIPWNEVQCVLWFPSFDSYGDDLDGKKQLLQNFFEYLAIRILADDLHEVQVIITMNNIIFSQLQVEKLGRESFFILTESFAFDETSFGELHDVVTPRRPMMISRATSYVFSLLPASDKHFGDYAATIKKQLHEIQTN